MSDTTDEQLCMQTQLHACLCTQPPLSPDMQRKLTVENPSINFVMTATATEFNTKCTQTTDLHEQDELWEPLYRLHHESKK